MAVTVVAAAAAAIAAEATVTKSAFRSICQQSVLLFIGDSVFLSDLTPRKRCRNFASDVKDIA
jgi:hypothetical protein